MSSPANSEEKDGLLPGDQTLSHKFDLALVGTAEKPQFAHHDFLPSGRIKAGMTQFALGIFVYAAFIVLCGLH